MAKERLIWLDKPPGYVCKLDEGILIKCDALELLNSLKDECADIIFLDPPFNLGKKYGSKSKKEDKIADSEYEEFMRSVLFSAMRKLKEGGALYLYHLPQWAIKFGALLQQQLTFRHWISVTMKNGFVRGKYLYPAHYALLYLTNGEPQVFNRPKIPAPTCRSCGKYIKDYGGYKHYIESGINLSDVWDDLSPVRHAKHKKRAENELPLELTRRVIQISGLKNGLLVDPFVGSGTSLISAVEAQMSFVACDREEIYCDIASRRVKEYMAERTCDC